MKKLYQFTVTILDDETFSPEEMTAAVEEAIHVHVEALGALVELQGVHTVILDDHGDIAEA